MHFLTLVVFFEKMAIVTWLQINSSSLIHNHLSIQQRIRVRLRPLRMMCRTTLLALGTKRMYTRTCLTLTQWLVRCMMGQKMAFQYLSRRLTRPLLTSSRPWKMLTSAKGNARRQRQENVNAFSSCARTTSRHLSAHKIWFHRPLMVGKDSNSLWGTACTLGKGLRLPAKPAKRTDFRTGKLYLLIARQVWPSQARKTRLRRGAARQLLSHSEALSWLRSSSCPTDPSLTRTLSLPRTGTRSSNPVTKVPPVKIGSGGSQLRSSTQLRRDMLTGIWICKALTCKWKE